MDQPTAKVRRAIAGRLLLENPSRSMASVLKEAGYSAHTARTPTQHGLSAEACVKALAEVEPSVSSATLVRQARDLLTAKLNHLLEPATLRKTPAAQVARIVSVVEQFHGGHDPSSTDLDARQFGSRLAWMEKAIQAYRRVKSTEQNQADPNLD